MYIDLIAAVSLRFALGGFRESGPAAACGGAGAGAAAAAEPRGVAAAALGFDGRRSGAGAPEGAKCAGGGGRGEGGVGGRGGSAAHAAEASRADRGEEIRKRRAWRRL